MMKGDQKRVEFLKSLLVLCEGPGDKRFLDGLLKDYDIPRDNIFVWFVCGISKLADFLKTSRAASPSFSDNVKSILILADNDNDCQKSFDFVKAALREAGFPVPDVQKKFKKKVGYPAVCVSMLPFDAPGNLETLCLEAAYAKWGIKDALDQYVASTPARDWPISSQSKMRIQSMIAATNKRNPDINLANHFCRDENIRLPFKHESYDLLADFLSKLDELIASAD